jgi:hypothetical protein
MNVNSAVQKWEPGTPPRKRSRAAMEAPYSPPYSPAYAVENFGTSEAIRHAAEATGAEEGWSASTVEREKKAALEKQTKKAGRGRGRKHRKTKKRKVGRARPPPKEDKYPDEELELLLPGGRRSKRMKNAKSMKRV